MVGMETADSQVIEQLDRAFGHDGFLTAIARAALTEPRELTPDDVADIIMPPRDDAGKPLEPRFQLVEGARGEVVNAAKLHHDAIFEFAETVGMIRDVSMPRADRLRVDTQNALWVVPGGARVSSVVRRELADQAMAEVYGLATAGQVLHQFGGSRRIPKTRDDGTANPEYGIARDIGGEFLPGTDKLTEFMVGLASSRNAGYDLVDLKVGGEVAVHTALVRRNESPDLFIIQPHETDPDGLRSGLTAVARLVGKSLAGRQWVLVANGQYRPQFEWQARIWAKQHQVTMAPPVAFGDEPGFRVQHADEVYTTAARGDMVYVNEGIVLHRMRKL